MVQKISKFLLEDDTPLFPEIEKTFGLSPKDILPGVRCPNCPSSRMVRKDRTWICPHCLNHSYDAYHDAILDYFLFNKPTITNKELREYLGIECIKTASKLLLFLDLPSTGQKKGRIYHRPTDFLELLEARYHRLTKK